MIAKLEFNLPEEQYDFKLASHAGAMASFLYEFQNWVRSEIKHGEKASLSYEDLRTKFYDLLKDNGVPEEVLYG